MTITRSHLFLAGFIMVGALTSTFVPHQAVWGARTNSVAFFGSSGAPVTDFFADLPTDLAVARQVAHPMVPIMPACARKESVWSKAETLLGLSTVVYAQSYCDSNAPCVRGTNVSVVSCAASCSGGTMTQTDSGGSGTTTDGNLNCGGTTGCGCEVTTC